MSQKPISIDDLRRALAVISTTAGSSDFDLNPEARQLLPASRKLRPAAVLLPLLPERGRLMVVLTKRASHLKHHPGQISLPGGKVDASDRDVCATALREAHEEIGLLPSNVTPLGVMPRHESITGFDITPVIGLVNGLFTPKPEPGEVEEVFTVPLDHLARPANYQIEGRIWQGRKRYYYTVPYGPYYIWGATARILRVLADGLHR